MCFVFSRYESFQICRKKNFFNENGGLLLRRVHKYLPLTINYDKQAKDVFLYLAKVSKYVLFRKFYYLFVIL